MGSRYKYQLQVCQQPIRARMCGFGDKDRRQISPPPCVKLRIFDTYNNTEILDYKSIDVSCFALCVDLWSPDESTNMSLVLPSGEIFHQRPGMKSSSVMPHKNLIGSLVSTGFKLYDTNERPGIWFIFQDLSIRTEGEFKLRFSFVQTNHGSAPILCRTFSSGFRSYSPKKFPGVIESTPLSRTFALQGVKISVRRDSKQREKEQVQKAHYLF